jgi:thioredoxin 1
MKLALSWPSAQTRLEDDLMTCARFYTAAPFGTALRMISEIDASQFDREVRTSAEPVLVEFFTDHCHFCQEVLPILAEIATERAKTLRVFKFNAGEDPRFASQFRIAAVPNFILFHGGVPIGQRSGFASKRDFLVWIDSATNAPL